MSRAAGVRQADIDRTLKALANNGLCAASIVVRAGGEVVITPGPLTETPAAQQGDDLDAWRERKNARRASERS